MATDVADTIDGMLPQIMRMFVSSGRCGGVRGQGQPWVGGRAKLGYCLVNHLFYVRNDGIGVIRLVQDALLQRSAGSRYGAEEETDDAKQKYEGRPRTVGRCLCRTVAAGRDARG